MSERLFDLPETPAKGRRQRIQGWSKMNAEQLWNAWRAQFQDDDDAIMTAIWIGNRLCKGKARSSRRTFYSVKDAAIARYGSQGRRAREEKRMCYGCNGTGEDDWGNGCDRCDGTGVYSSRWLYLHEFTVAGQHYALHSYVQPQVLLDEPSADLESYGGSFAEAELKALALPFTGILRLLGYVAAAKWNLQFDGEGYR